MSECGNRPGQTGISHALNDGNGHRLNETEEEGQVVLEMNSGMELMLEPMMMHLILERVFNFCSAAVLKSCRLVCKTWCNASLIGWRNRAILQPGKKVANLRNFKAYLQLLQSKDDDDALELKKYPFKNFRIRGGHKELLSEAAKPVSDIVRYVAFHNYIGAKLNEYLSKFISLVELELCDCDWSWGQRAQEEDVVQVPTLRRLKIIQTHASRAFKLGNPASQYLFQSLPNLKAFEVEYRAGKGYIHGVLNVLQALRNSRIAKGGNNLSLKELRVIHLPNTRPKNVHSSAHNARVIDTIIECQFPLEKLIIHLVWGEADFRNGPHPLYRLLEECKDTLRYLQMSFIFNASEDTINAYNERMEVNPIAFQMKALKEVHLRNGWWGYKILADLELPNIVKLVVDCGEMGNTLHRIKPFQLSFPKERVYERMERFEFLDKRTIPGPDAIISFAKMMPNLTHLTMPLDKQSFRQVCKHFVGLKTLHALGALHQFEALDDETLTGVSVEMRPGEPRSPNITDLSFLIELSIACENLECATSATFTDRSVTHGFLQLPRLCSLSVSFDKISEETKMELLNHVRGNVNIQVKAIPVIEIDGDTGMNGGGGGEKKFSFLCLSKNYVEAIM